MPALMAYIMDYWNQPARTEVYKAPNSYGAFFGPYAGENVGRIRHGKMFDEL